MEKNYSLCCHSHVLIIRKLEEGFKVLLRKLTDANFRYQPHVFKLLPSALKPKTLWKLQQDIAKNASILTKASSK
jgi:hypothetical protein